MDSTSKVEAIGIDYKMMEMFYVRSFKRPYHSVRSHMIMSLRLVNEQFRSFTKREKRCFCHLHYDQCANGIIESVDFGNEFGVEHLPTIRDDGKTEPLTNG